MIHLDNNLPNVNRKGLFHKLDRNTVNIHQSPSITMYVDTSILLFPIITVTHALDCCGM